MTDIIQGYISGDLVGFREAVQICKAAKKAGAKVVLIADNKEGRTDSILSIVQLGITRGKYVMIKVYGSDIMKNLEVLNRIKKILGSMDEMPTRDLT